MLYETKNRKETSAGELQMPVSERDVLVLVNRSMRLALGEQVYRVGGDEFLVLLHDIPADYVARQEETVRSVSREKDTPLAVGSAWSPRVPSDLSDLIDRADEKMYADKKAYYAQFT